MSEPSDKTVGVSIDSAADAARAAAAPMGGDQFAPGTLVAARYRIASILGAGGMGEVYRAEDRKLGQIVALKFLPAHLTRDPVRVQRLHDEVRIGRQVSHPNVCRTYDIGEWGDHSFVAMEYVDGEDLARLLKRIGRVSHERAVEIARGIAAGLSAAHAKGVVHRDLKPANVLIDSEGVAHITDFGLALLADDAQHGSVAGTPAYVAPEQLAGQPATVQSDLYALGLVMYELFTGRRAHTAQSFVERLRDASDITHPSDFVRDLDPAVERIILRCLANDPAQRPRSAREVVESLPGGDLLHAAIAAGETPSPRIVAAAGTEGSLAPGKAWLLLSATIVLFALLILLRQQTAVTNFVSLDRSPDVLHDRASALLKTFGVPATGDPIAEFGQKWFVGWLESTRQWGAMKSGPPALVYRIDYGISPREWEVMPPSATAPGRTSIEVDTQGRLTFLLAGPEASWTPRRLDWRALLVEAGLEPRTMKSETPGKEPPPAAFDSRRAWSGTYPGSKIPIRVEAAAWKGTPVYFEVRTPWDQPGSGAVPGMPGVAFAVVYTVVFAIVALAVLLAWRNLSTRRSDRQAALHFAFAAFVLQGAANLLSLNYAGELRDVFTHAWRSVGSALVLALVLFVLYIALEPYVRRRWPEKLISWSRLIAGRVRDPMVGRDVLIGVLAGVAYALLGTATRYAQALATGTEPGPSWGVFPYVKSMRHTIAHLLDAPVLSMYFGFLTIVLLVLMTTIFRKRVLGIVVFSLIVAGLHVVKFTAPADIPILVAIAALVILVSVRYGMLALIAMRATFTPLMDMPAANGAAWVTTLAAIPFLAVIALALWAFYVSLGGQSPWKMAAFDE